MKYTIIYSTLTCLALAATHVSNAAPAGEVLEFGYYQALSEGTRYDYTDSTSGVVQSNSSVKLLQQTNIIPIEPGRMFGFRFKLRGLPNHSRAIEIREVIKHPSIVKPDKSKTTGYETYIPLDIKNGEVVDYAGYRLDHDYELVEGEWRFEFWYDDRKILEKKFTTVTPKQAATPEAQSAARPRPANAR